MCGIAGYWIAGGLRAESAEESVKRMADSLVHRGPDDSGTWTNPEIGVALGFRRLAIIDLTALGHQPMMSPSGRFHIVFNGEIYNHKQLREDLEAIGVQFRGRSDTEVLCAGFERWGMRETLIRAAGMFAIAAWDSKRNVLSLARDRIGIKPLYVNYSDGHLAFASELKAIHQAPGFKKQLDTEALSEYMGLLYVPGPSTIWKNVRKLTPGSILEISDPSRPLPHDEPFWSVREVALKGRANGNVLSDTEADIETEIVLQRAISEHMEADVPLGAFLSGGIDSSTVVALMQESSNIPVRTFTVKFDDPVHDEAEHAEAVAKHLGTDHTTIPLSGNDALDLIPRLPSIYDEPFADSSQLPTLLVSEAARRHVTVVLTGDGGDELMGGYNRYIHGISAFKRADSMPNLVRSGIAKIIDATPAGLIDRSVSATSKIIPAAGKFRLAEQKVRKLSHLLRSSSDGQRYLGLMSTSYGVTHTPHAISNAFNSLPTASSLLDRMLLADQLAYLPDNQMTKVDRASMAVSLEARVPLLDHRVIELSWRLPHSRLIREGVGKWALRNVLYKRVPRSLIDRPKTGFSVPLAMWLRGPLREWTEQLLSESALKNGPLNVNDVLTQLKRLYSGHDDSALAVWSALQFESWRKEWSV